MSLPLQASESVKLGTCLRGERETLEQCVALLEQEQKLLIDGDIDALPALTRKKNSAVALAARSTATREHCLKGRGLPLDSDGMAELLHDQPALRTMWYEILNRAKEARDLNRVNGFLIDARIDRNHHALAVMHQAANTTTTYGNDGHFQHAIPVRALGVG
jgi:flagellar biosynthesis protein FlgN